VPAGI